MVNFRILRGADGPGLSRWAQYNHKHHIGGRQEDQRGDVTMETEIEMMCFEDGGTGLCLLCSNVGPLVQCNIVHELDGWTNTWLDLEYR